MSGIAGIVNLDGAPVDRTELARMAALLVFRGPDAQDVRVEGAAGLACALLRTTDESASERQPLTVDGNVWIVADARVDARSDLVTKLRARGHDVTVDVPDVELILRAYCVWQESCVDHLLGDFAFAVWDAPRHCLLLARDHLGIRQLFYACVGHSVVFSNTLDSVRRHSGVTDRLNELAIADFLLFDLNQDKATTTFADIQRLPPAHSLRWSKARVRARRYWAMPIDEPIFYRRHDDYIDRFNELLGIAVADRLRIHRVGVFMSGGLDSTAIATTARNQLQGRSGSARLRAFSNFLEGDDPERYYAGMVAGHLGISISFRGWDPRIVDPEWHQAGFDTAEPAPYPASLAAERAYLRTIADYSRVAFHGEGPDNALHYEWQAYFSYLVGKRRFGQLFKDVYNHSLLHRRVPLPASFFRMLTRERDKQPGRPFPDWLNPDFESRLQLRERWDHITQSRRSAHPIRPRGYRSFDLPIWQAHFEGFDAASTDTFLEVRHPFLDLRLLRFLLALPAVPWCREKYLLRVAMRGMLPEPVLRRPKSPQTSDPWAERVVECGLPPLVSHPGLERYVDASRVPGIGTATDPYLWATLRTLSLNCWLRNLSLRRIEEELEDGHKKPATSTRGIRQESVR